MGKISPSHRFSPSPRRLPVPSAYCLVLSNTFRIKLRLILKVFGCPQGSLEAIGNFDLLEDVI
jgi:hypothetical protein